MKTYFYLILAIISFPCHAVAQFACSGVDRVDIYVNHKLVATATPADAPTVKLDPFSKTDTIVLHAFTNWEGLKNSTLDVKDEYGELMDHVNSTGNTGYEAIFTYIFIRTNLDDPDLFAFDMFLNLLCERNIETEHVVTINLTPN